MDEIERVEQEELGFWARHRFLVLIALTIVISLILVGVGLAAYNLSGASQLDLSRPGLEVVSDQVVNESQNIGDYSATGPVNTTTIEEFKKLFDEQAESASAIDAFAGDPLNPQILEFGQKQSNE